MTKHQKSQSAKSTPRKAAPRPRGIQPGSIEAIKVSGGRDLPGERAREAIHNAAAHRQPKQAAFKAYVQPKPTAPTNPGYRPANPGPAMPFPTPKDPKRVGQPARQHPFRPAAAKPAAKPQAKKK